MIEARFINESGLITTYRDIWDTSIDQEAVSGVDFFSQEARKASFKLKRDDWIRNNIIEPFEVRRFGYIPILIELRVDGVVVFCGFTKDGCPVDDQGDRGLVTITIDDILYVLLTYNENEVFELIPDFTYGVSGSLVNALDTMINNASELFGAFGVNVQNLYVDGGMDLMIYLSAFDWADEPQGGVARYSNVVRQDITAIYESGVWAVQYVLYDQQLDIDQDGDRYRYTKRQHLILKNGWFLGGQLAIMMMAVLMDPDGAVSSHSREFDLSDYSSLAAMQSAASHWAEHDVPDLRDSYTIQPANYITTFTTGGVQYRIQESRLEMLTDPAAAFRTKDDVTEVAINEWMGGLLRVMCAYLFQSERTLQIRARLNYPGSTISDIAESSVIKFSLAEKQDISGEMSFSYLLNGEAIGEGINEYFESTVSRLLARSFRLILVGRDYALGQTIRCRGWTIMITAIRRDIRRNFSEIEGVGGR